MAATNDHIPDFDDFERYYSGEMPLAEQRLLEGKMLAEPLLAEAYEGFLVWRAGNTRAENVRADLQERLGKRLAPARRKSIPVWHYVSAASVVLALWAYWAFFSRDHRIDVQKPEVATTRKEVAAPKPEQADVNAPIQPEKPHKSVTSGVAKPDALISGKPGLAIRSGQIPQAAPKPEPALTTSVLADAEERQDAAEIVLADSIRAENHIAQTPAQPANALIAPGTAQAVRKSMAARVRSEEKAVDTQYIVSHRPAYDGKKIDDIVVRVDTLSALPRMGWPSYQAHLDRNTDSASITAQIMVTFAVSASGVLSDFVAKGPEQLQKDAIRLISNGPAWAPARVNGRPVKSVAQVQLQFRRSQ
ncbi:hypothetical protein [Dyadobacter sp. OTU695]|uniref:hypothetical protein n=1 Tax=Dyadobacter sp. OTU695 TaxID=3043860 RepID=UPI00313B728E